MPVAQEKKLKASQREPFRLGISLLLESWTVFQLTRQHEPCGPDTGEMLDDLKKNLINWLEEEGLLGLEVKDIEDYIQEVFTEDFSTDIEDNSVREISTFMLQCLHQCSADNFQLVEKLKKEKKDEEERLKQANLLCQQQSMLDQIQISGFSNTSKSNDQKLNSKIETMKKYMMEDQMEDEPSNTKPTLSNSNNHHHHYHHDQNNMSDDEAMNDDDDNDDDDGGWTTVASKK